jgi:hypothetical protein
LSHYKPRFLGLHEWSWLEARLLRRGPERRGFLTSRIVCGSETPWCLRMRLFL